MPCVKLQYSRFQFNMDYFFSLQDPTFISMTVMPESEMSVEGDDDKIYLFFGEKTVENDSYKEVTVSSVARVCKVIVFVVHMCSLWQLPKPQCCKNDNCCSP